MPVRKSCSGKQAPKPDQVGIGKSVTGWYQLHNRPVRAVKLEEDNEEETASLHGITGTRCRHRFLTGPFVSRPKNSEAPRMRAERQSLLLRGAADIFLAHGFHGSSMDDVARRIGVSKVVLYRFFEGKDAIMAAILHQGLRDIEEADRLWFDVSPDYGGGLLGALRHIRCAGPPPLLVMRFASQDPQYRHFYEAAADSSRQRTADRLSSWLVRNYCSHPMWNAIVVHIADFSLNGFMRWIDTGKPDLDPEFEGWMLASLRALSLAARATMVGSAELPARDRKGNNVQVG